MPTYSDTHYKAFAVDSSALSEGQRVTYTSSGLAAAGVAASIGTMVADAAASDEAATVRLWSPPVIFLAGGSIAVGDRLYQAASGEVLAAGTGNAIPYIAIETASDGDLFSAVAILPDNGLAYSTTSATVAGGTLAIPVTARIVTKSTGGVEALTLADGTPGQELTIIMGTDGGDGTLTPATSTGWATCVFADTKDTLHLKYIDDTVGWIVTGYNGTAGPPVLT